MATDTAYSPIRAHLIASAPAGTVFRWENEAEDPPRAAADQEAPIWVKVEITGDVVEMQSIGAGDPTDNFWRETGIVLLHVMTPRGRGTLEGRQLARQLIDACRGAELVPQIQFNRFAIGFGQVAEEMGQWWLLPVEMGWYRDY